MNKQSYCVGDRVRIKSRHPYYKGRDGTIRKVLSEGDDDSYIIEVELKSVLVRMKGDWLELVDNEDGE